MTNEEIYDKINSIIKNERAFLSKPKFKVGDRVKVDWDSVENSIYKATVFRAYNRLPLECVIDKEHPDKGLWLLLPIGEDVKSLGIEEKYLTLIESKPKCKFKELENVEMTDAWMKRYNTDRLQSLTRYAIITSIDDYIHVRELRTDGWKFTCAFDEADEYLKYPEKKKEKWSIGTYVEILKSYQQYKAGDFYLIIPRSSSDNTLKLRLEVGGKLEGDIKYIYGRDLDHIENDLIKWYENKPEKNIYDAPRLPKNYDLVISDAEMDNKVWNDDKCWEYYRDRYTAVCDPYKSGIFDLSALEDAAKYIKSHGAQPPYIFGGATAGKEVAVMCNPYLDYPERLADCFKFKYNILDKPEITISKQKKINININKPKI